MTPPEPPLLVCVAGADASGKSTQIDALTAALTEAGIDTAGAGIWDALADPVIGARLPFADRAAVLAYLSVLGPNARAHFLFHALHAALDLALARNPRILLLNAYWYKYFATEVAHGGDPATLRAATTAFPPPALTFHLRVTPETALARRTDPSDYESGYGDAARFLEFQRRSHAELDRLGTELGWIELDATTAPEVLTRTMLDAVTAAARP
ncbi:hypothetical protein [Nocardia asteroides]|uniref:hypothetical protein n=1 Tax=Nocardia asteroides TaxID=1824 RepID=UPI001E4A881E|nr:hypothetical protein [Nocardia asteroides]UGT62044.1 hypothetical protein LTT61_01415 [Nocardia asteroides]